MFSQHSEERIILVASKLKVSTNNICCMCLTEIKVMAFKNTGVCSEDCRKDRDNDHEPATGIINGT